MSAPWRTSVFIIEQIERICSLLFTHLAPWGYIALDLSIVLSFGFLQNIVTYHEPPTTYFMHAMQYGSERLFASRTF